MADGTILSQNVSGRLLQDGTVTVFIRRTDGVDPGPRTPVLTLEGPAIVALGSAPPGWSWDLGRGLNSELTELEGPGLDDEEALRAAATRSIEALGELLRPAATPPAGRVVKLGRRPAYVAAQRAAVVDHAAWARPVEGVPALVGAVLPAGGAPLPARLALTGGRYTMVTATPLDEVAVPELLDGLAWLFRRAADTVLDELARRVDADTARVLRGPDQDATIEDHGVQLLAAELAADTDRMVAPMPTGDPLVACAAIVGGHAGLTVTAPTGGLRGREGTAAVRAIALASRLYVRRVSLVGHWWKGADSAVLGFRPDGEPVALLPSDDAMVAIDVAGDRWVIDGEQAAARLLDGGFVLSKPLDDEKVTARTLLRTAVAGRGRLAAGYLAWAVAIAVLGLAVPRAAGVVFGEIIPESDRSRLWALTGILVAFALASLPLQLVFSVARTRLETAASLDVQRGMFGRMLRMPASTIQRFGIGDVTVRLQGLEAIRDPIEQSVIGAVPALLTGVFAGAMLFTFDATLAVIAVVTGSICLAVALLLAAIVAREQRRVDAAAGEVGGFLLQVLTSIPKLRVAAAEPRAFHAWALRFRHAVGQRLLRVTGDLSLFSAMVQTIGMLTLFGGVSALGPRAFDVGIFMAFQTTYGMFLGGVGAFIGAASTAMMLRPAIGRALELAQSDIESAPNRADPGELTGAVALADVTFRYQPNSRPVLDGFSLRVEPSELVVITGPSGCGKSTLIRLLLGFEQPEQGSVLFDDQDLTSLDVEAVRRQLGVVLQDGQLAPGTIRDNIAGVAALGDDELWELAALVALDEDIKAMPMGLDTVITLNGGAFSGGQRQRLLIARALANRPRILILDEATSALDNVTQRVITENLAALGMTRIVIAHRLSTMIDADRICVLDGGRIAEEGSYTALMARRGRFHALASRQLL